MNHDGTSTQRRPEFNRFTRHPQQPQTPAQFCCPNHPLPLSFWPRHGTARLNRQPIPSINHTPPSLSLYLLFCCFISSFFLSISTIPHLIIYHIPGSMLPILYGPVDPVALLVVVVLWTSVTKQQLSHPNDSTLHIDRYLDDMYSLSYGPPRRRINKEVKKKKKKKPCKIGSSKPPK